MSLKGADISFEGNAAAMKAAGLDFAIAECSIGMSENPSGRQNLSAFKKAGLAASLYHFCIFTNDPAAEAKALVTLVKAIEAQMGRCDFAIAIDIEQPKSATDLTLPLPAPQIIAWLNTFIAGVSDGMGYYPLAYSYSAYLKMLDVPELKTSELKNCPLWLADYSHGLFPDDSAVGLIFQPGPFLLQHNPWARVAMFQTKGNTTIPGVPHIVDTDAFMGSESDLKATTGSLLSNILSVRTGIIAGIIAAIAAGFHWFTHR